MKVALAFPGCHRRGGVERVTLACANFLAVHGHETHVLATDWDASALHPAVVRHTVPRWRGPAFLASPAFARRSAALLRRLDPAVDALGTFGVQGPPGGVMWVQSVHKAWLKVSRGHRGLAGRMRQRLNPFHPVALAMENRYLGGRLYRKLIALTDRVKADLIRLYDVPPGDVVTLPNGFEPAEFGLHRRARDRAAVRERLGYGADDRVVVFAANELARKGFGPLIRAVARLKDPSLRVLVAGRVDPRPYAAEIDRLGLASRVAFVGPAADVAAYYAAGDVFVLPTEYEAWGLVIVEAMACGLPVLTSRLAGAATAVDEGRTGFLLDDPRDVDDITTKLGLLVAGRHADAEVISGSVTRYAWSNVLVEYEEFLGGNALANRPAPAAAGTVAR